MFASNMYGTGPQVPSYGVAAPTQAIGVVDTLSSGWRGIVNPENPLVWFGVILAVTVGAAGVAGSVRLGKAKLSASLDEA